MIGANFTLAFDSNGFVWAWGGNTFGDLGRSEEKSYVKPFRLSNLNDIVQISAGYTGGLALTKKGKIWRWCAANNIDHFCQTPQKLNLQDIVTISSGSYHSLALTNKGEVIGWGRNDEQQVTDKGWTGGTRKPMTLANNALAISAGNYHSLVLTKDKKILAWGDGFSKGPLGLKPSPELLPLLFSSPWIHSLHPTTLEIEIRNRIKDSIAL